MPITISRTKTAGKAKATGSKPAVKRTAAKAAPKATANKRTVKRTASEPAKRTVSKPKATASSENGGGRNAGLTKQWEKTLTLAGQRLKDAQREHTDAINALNEIAQEAIDSNITMSAVSDLTGVSRQWLYKMKDHGERANGNGAAKASAKRTTAKAKPAAKASTAGSGKKRLSIKR